jgi:Fe-S cluster biogenesis protein NfuA
VATEKEFQQKIRQLGVLVAGMERTAGADAKAGSRELIQLLMEVHGAGLERLMEVVFESGPVGEAIIGKLGEDPIVRNLLLLYSLHPDTLETRVLKALETAGARLRKLDGSVELLGMQEGVVQLRIHTAGHACGSTAKTLQTLVEEAIYDLAPDVVSLSIPGQEEAPGSVSAGFVSLEALLGHPAVAQGSGPLRAVELEGAD